MGDLIPLFDGPNVSRDEEPDETVPVEQRPILRPRDFAVFPYPTPYSSLPWQPILLQADLPLDRWVWVSDRLYNIYPVRRTHRGLEAPRECELVRMQQAGLIDRPIRWLPWHPDGVALLIGQYLPGMIRRTRPNHG